MKKHRGEIPEDRDLTSDEVRLVRWLLERGKPGAQDFIPQLDGLRVVSRCPCGCPSINFVRSSAGGMEILADFASEDGDGDGHTIGVFVFASSGTLAGLEVWSIEGEPIPSEVPDPERLRPLA